MRHRLVLHLTPSQAMKFDDFIAETGLNKNLFVDRAILNFIDNHCPVNREDDARFLSYTGSKKTERREVSISDVVEAILEIKINEYRVSRSSLTSQALMAYIDTN